MTTIKDFLIIILAFFAMVWLYESCHRSSPVIESVSYYKYWIQAAIYHKLAWNNFIKVLPDAVEWNIVITFIVIDKYNQVYPYQVSKETLEMWLADFEDIEDKLKYHYENREYKLPYELALGNVTL